MRRLQEDGKTARRPERGTPAPPISPSPYHPNTLAVIDLALAEDIGGGDVTTTLTVPAERQARGRLLAKVVGVISGIEVAGEVFRRVDPAITFSPLVADGDAVAAMTPIATVEGPARSLLTAERVALNLLQRLSGVATVTARYVEAVRDTKARIVDTRKTTPGLRALEITARVTLTFDLIKQRPIAWPRIESPDELMTVGSARPMEDAARIAYAELIDWLVELGWDRLEAYEALTQIGDLYVGNMVDTYYSLVAKIRKEYAILEVSG